MATVSLSLDDIYNLAKKTLLANGCDEETSNILSDLIKKCLLYTSPSPRDQEASRMPSSA